MKATERARRVKLMIFDVDGVFTDGRLFFSAEGEVLKAFNVKDGLGIKLLAKAGIKTAIITGRDSGIVAARARELSIDHLFQASPNKVETFQTLLELTGLQAPDCGFMGDDWPDLAVMQRCGFTAAPANGHPEVRARAHWVASLNGGEGAVREMCDMLLAAQHRYDALLQAALGH
jgi:3-deoxy-D-manno-octulosonate 8-phosphate phosphatase (KDO 8-P phosphatase)